MPRIDPQQLLKTLGVLLGPHGGIKSSEEVVRLVQLMQKFSRKLVSKCIYIRILKATPNELLEHFLSERGWELLNQWFSDAIKTQNWPLCREMIQLFNMCHISATRLKENVDENHAPKLINQLRQEDSVDEDIKSLATEVYIKWVRTVSPAASAQITHNKTKQLGSSKAKSISEDSETTSDGDNNFSKEGKDGTISLLQSLADEVSENIKKEENKKNKIDKVEKRDEKLSKTDSHKISHRGDEKHKEKSKHSHSHSSSHRSSHDKDRRKESGSSKRDSSSRHSSRDKDREHRRIRHTDARDEVNDEEKQRIREKARKLKEEAQAKKDKETLTKVSGSSSASSLSKIPKIPKKSIKEEDKKTGSSFSDMLGTLDSKPSTWRKPLLKNKTAAMLESMTKSSTAPKSSKDAALKSSSSASIKKEHDNGSKEKESSRKNSSSSLITGKKDLISNKTSVNGESRRPTLTIPDSSKDKKSPGKESPKQVTKSPSITSSTGFMDAIFSTMKKDEPKKRKRRLSDREDSKLDEKTNSHKESSPDKKLKEDPENKIKQESAPIPTFSFYRELDTTESTADDSKKDNSTKIKTSPNSSPSQKDDEPDKNDLDGDVKNNGIKEERIGDDTVIPFDEPRDTMPREVKGILVYHRGKDKRNKTIKWKPESNLVAVRYFELDEDERVNVNKLKFENMREFETKMEKAALASKTDIGNDEQETAKWYKPVPLTFDENSDYKPCFSAYGSQSTEKATQNEREKTVLQALYFKPEMTPNTPAEPDNPSDSLRGLSNGMTIIPLEDKDADDGSYHDYTHEGWPDSKANKVDNEYAASISSAFSLPPALSSLLATIETGGLESIIPSPGSLSQEDQSTLAAQTAALQKLGMIPGVDINPSFPPPMTNLAPNNGVGKTMNMNDQSQPGRQNMPQQKPPGLEPFANHNMPGFPPPGHNMPHPPPFEMAPPHMQDNGFNNFNQHPMQQNHFSNGPFPGGMPNHRPGNPFGRGGGNHNGFRGNDGPNDFFNNDRDNFRDRSRDGRKHDEPPPSKIRTRPCKFFVERGTCRDGDRCNFIHPQN